MNNPDSITVKAADEKERGLIIDAKYKALNKLGLRDLQALKFAGSKVYRKYNKLVMDYLPPKWMFFYQAYSLIIGKNAIRKEYMKIQKRRLELNEKSIERMKKCLKVINNKSDQAKLINKLISLISYDDTLDKRINALYKENKEQYFKTLKEKKKKVYKLEAEIESLQEKQESKDDVDQFDIQAYAEDLKTQEGNKEFEKMSA